MSRNTRNELNSQLAQYAVHGGARLKALFWTQYLGPLSKMSLGGFAHITEMVLVISLAIYIDTELWPELVSEGILDARYLSILDFVTIIFCMMLPPLAVLWLLRNATALKAKEADVYLVLTVKMQTIEFKGLGGRAQSKRAPESSLYWDRFKRLSYLVEPAGVLTAFLRRHPDWSAKAVTSTPILVEPYRKLIPLFTVVGPNGFDEELSQDDIGWFRKRLSRIKLETTISKSPQE